MPGLNRFFISSEESPTIPISLKIMFGPLHTRKGQTRSRPMSFQKLEDRTLLSINVTEYRYDTSSSGVDANETVLTPANVTAGSFGKQFTAAVDGQVLAQPLYMANLSITVGAGGTHNVVFVATEHDSLYAIDATSGQTLWHDSFLIGAAGVTVTSVPSADVNSGDISPEIGITGTPAIDAASGFLFVVAKTKAVYSSSPSNPHYVNTLYKVNLSSGAFTSAVIADTTYNSDGSYTYNSGPYSLGAGDGSITVNGQSRVYFNSLRQMFRPGVELVNGQVILGSASHGDNGPYHGWMLTYSETTLGLTGVLDTTPNGGLGGIWSGGDGIVSDSQGNFYFETGNGTFNQSAGNFNAQGFPIDGDYGDSFVEVAVDPSTSQSNQNVNGWGLKVIDYFTPYNQATLAAGDTDLGSGGPTLLPASAGSGAHPNLLVGGGKQGSIYLVNRDAAIGTSTSMGEFSASTDNVVQEVANAVGGIYSTPTYFNGQVYFTPGSNGSMQAFSLSNGRLSTASDLATQDSFGNLDGGPIISADGTANGIVWALERGSNELRAYSAATLAEIYNSSTLANNADAPGTIMKYTEPLVANGSVFVGTGNALVMYGLNAPPTSAPAAPSNLVVAGASGNEVTLHWTDNSNNESAFNIQRSTDNVTFAAVGVAGVDQTTYIDSSVQPFTKYYYRADASNAIGSSAYSNVAPVETLGQPSVGGGDGLLGQYYSGTNNNFGTATPLLTRVDPAIDFNWSATPPSPAVGLTNYEVRWTGEVQAQFSEAYTFTTTSDDGVRVYVNGQLLINDFTAHSATVDTSSPLALEAGQSYAIEVDYFQGGGNAVIDLQWSSPHTSLEDIPQSQLFSGSAPAAPTGLQVAAISSTQTNLTWTRNSTDEDGYEVDRELGTGAFSAVAYLPAGSSQYLDTGLTAGSTYTYQVRATNFLADSAWSNAASVTLDVPPDPISSAMPTTVAARSIAMAWTNNADNATAIRIYRGVGSEANPAFIAALPATASTYTDLGPGGQGLTPGTSYTYYVQCGNLAGYTAASTFSVQTLANAPAEVLATPASGQVTLSWLASPGAQTYNVYRGTTPGGENSTPAATGLTSTFYTDSSVTNGTVYYYKVTALDSGGESAPSAESLATPAASTAAAPAPASLTAAAGNRSVVLAWPAVSGAVTYNVYRGTASGGETLLKNGVVGLSYDDTGLTNGTSYFYQVTSVNSVGEGPRSGEASAAPQVSAPPTPIQVAAAAGDGQVNLSWSAASDALTYNVYRSLASGNEVLYEQGITATSFTDSSVTDGVTYYYQVSAGNGVGQSNLSLEVAATPLPPLPAVPGALTAQAVSSLQIRLNWTESPAGATSFTLQRSTDGLNFSPLTTLDGSVRSFTDAAGLTAGATYWYRLSANNLAGASGWSGTVAARTPQGQATAFADADIGTPAITGRSSYSGGVFTVSGSGAGLWNSIDQFHYVYTTLTGDGTLIAEVDSLGNTDPWAKAGIMFRSSLAPAAAWAAMEITPGNGAVFQTRDSAGDTSLFQSANHVAPAWVELVRSGSTFFGYVSADGVNWTQVAAATVAMTPAIDIGLFVTSHSTSQLNTATFANISNGSGGGSSPPAAPSGLTATAASGTSVSLAWTNNDMFGLTDQIYRQSPGSAVYSLIATVPASNSSYLDTGLTAGNSYSYEVMAGNAAGSSSPSNTAEVATPVVPLAVSSLQPASITSTGALLTWTLNDSNDTGVQVLRRSGGAGSFALAATLTAGSTSYSDTGLQPGTLYEYQVVVIDLAGASPAADTGLTTIPLAPVVTAKAGAGQIQLTWPASNGAVAYNVYRGLTSGGEGTAPYATINNADSFTDTGVTSLQTYYYRVTAVDFSGESPASAEVSAEITQNLAAIEGSAASAEAVDQFGKPLANQPVFEAGLQIITSPLQLAGNVALLPAEGSQWTFIGGISGAGGLTVNGSGTVILDGADSYSGGTAVAAGTLIVGGASAIPAGSSLSIGVFPADLSASAIVQPVTAAALPEISASAGSRVMPTYASAAASSPAVSTSPAAPRPATPGTIGRSPLAVSLAQTAVFGPLDASRITVPPAWLSPPAAGSIGPLDGSDQQQNKELAIRAMDAVFADYRG
jgi:autotransporter-associated beta strand protein